MPRPIPTMIDCAMATAAVWSLRTKCTNHQVGCCIITAEGKVVSLGYNGPVQGDIHCTDKGCAKVDGVGKEREKRRCRGMHAEINAIINSAHPKDLAGAIMVTTIEPCYDCAKAIAQSMIKRVVYRDPYQRVPDDDLHISERQDVVDLFRRRGIALEEYEPSVEIETKPKGDE